jgi:hypothetical protein
VVCAHGGRDASRFEVPFSVRLRYGEVIRATADPAKADKRTRSKWSRVMRYAAACKPDSEALDRFVQRKGGINACAARFSRCVGRGTEACKSVNRVGHNERICLVPTQSCGRLASDRLRCYRN